MSQSTTDHKRRTLRTVIMIAAEIVLILIVWGVIQAIMYPAQVGGPGR